jgi:tRNA threonylcarbamoyl adenosine modification protein (Sua5/YciO/YrdC/YwlC family)
LQKTSDKSVVVDCLNSGGVVLMHTDTIPGFHCRADKPDAIQRIRDIKDRDDKPFLMLISDNKYVGNVSNQVSRYLSKCWPGPFTFILPASDDIDENINMAVSTVAVRMPSNKELLSILEQINCPVVSTSANRSGELPMPLSQATKELGDKVDLVYVVESSSAKSANSAIIDLVSWPPKLIREGPVDLPEIENSTALDD